MEVRLQGNTKGTTGSAALGVTIQLTPISLCQGGGKKARKGSIAEHEKVMKFLERQRDRERDSGGV